MDDAIRHGINTVIFGVIMFILGFLTCYLK